MQHVDNDMDDLFKRAAEDYPLREGGDDWESIAKRISDKSEDAIVPVGGNNNNRKIIAVCLLLLMLPVSWLIITHHATSNPTVATNVIKTGKDGKIIEPVIKNNDQPVFDNKEKNDAGITGDDQAGYLKKKLSKTARNIAFNITPAKSSESFTGNNEGIVNKNQAQKDPIIANADNNLAEGKNIQEANTNPIVEGQVTGKVVLEKRKKGEELKDHLKKIDSPAINQNSKKEKNTGLPKKNRFYIGVVAGPELSKVQSMAYSDAGIDGGLIAGLNFSQRLSVETGINWNNKHYNSQGKDFSMDKVGPTMAAGMVIDNLAGNSSLIEIPVKVKYDFVRKKRSSFFAAAGVSAYIMTKERNKYNVTMNGNQEKITGTYNKNNYGLPAVVDFSAGYQHTINDRLQIRIEPFLKIPLKGMGVGSLPITSTGLQVGIITRLK